MWVGDQCKFIEKRKRVTKNERREGRKEKKMEKEKKDKNWMKKTKRQKNISTQGREIWIWDYHIIQWNLHCIKWTIFFYFLNNSCTFTLHYYNHFSSLESSFLLHTVILFTICGFLAKLLEGNCVTSRDSN